MTLLTRPTRILQVVGGMNRGGVETWLMHVLRHIDRTQYQIDFLVHASESCAYDDEIRTLGSRVIPCLTPSRPWTYARNLRRILVETGPYDVVHSHVHHFSGFVLKLAAQQGVPVRIAHSHSDTSISQRAAGPLRRCYLRLMERWISTRATIGLAASRNAACALFGSNWADQPRFRVLHCGIDLSSFRSLPNHSQTRAELGLTPSDFVVGHVGSFGPPKNHKFFVEVARQLASRVPNVRFLLVGDGALRPSVERQVMRAGLSEAFVFTGVRSDVPRLLNAMDVFLFPSCWEGMPLSLVEAQAAGLPCFTSDAVTCEAQSIASLVQVLPLRAPAEEWARAILTAYRSAPRMNHADAVAVIEKGSFNIHASVRSLEDLYAAR